ncbi:unnamed protein product [Rhizophagus irregularis]|uniref:Uncharacterized protein n=1 Tax=Rhizophagus irregularis TaxID=588596 RepID=A0A915ZBB0_9GLOM|nr:unnamed protein product [Rhizophagus irregularis]
MFSNTFTQINKPHFVVYIFEVKLSLIFRRIIIRNRQESVEIAKRFQGGNSKEGMMEFESIGLHHLKETSSTIQPALKRKLNEKEMIIDSGNNPFYVSEHGKDPKNATNQKIEKQNSSSELPSSDVGPEDNDEIIGRSVRSMYRKDLKSDILEKAKTYELKWSDFHEVLALSSIIVLRLPCPYPAHIFTSREWQTIIHENPYIVADSVKSAFFHGYARVVKFYLLYGMHRLTPWKARLFFCQVIPKLAERFLEFLTCVVVFLMLPQPKHQRMSTVLNCYTQSFDHYFLLIRLNRATSGTATRPDFSCLVNEIPILNSEIKPPGFTLLQQQKID